MEVIRVFAHFLDDDAGAITIDWVTLTAGILIAGLLAVYAIFNNGVSALVMETNDMAQTALVDVDPGTVENMNQ